MTTEIDGPREALAFVRSRYALCLLVSAVLLVPVFWHEHVIACDLASHTYNAWLATRIAAGQEPSLYFAPQWSNVLFDIGLSRAGSMFGFGLGEKIVVSLAVLVFFWGAFALAAAASRGAPWFLAPLIAMFAYGWTFNIGFDNYYLSVALACWGVALFWHAAPRLLVLAIAFAALIGLAHPIGAAWFAGALAYVRLGRVLRGWILFALAVAFVLAVRFYLQSRYQVILPSRNFLLNGIDQIQMGARYIVLARVVLGLSVACVLLDLLLRRKDRAAWRDYFVPATLYTIAFAAVQLLPDAILVPQYPAPLTFIGMRLTLICAVAATCVLATATPRVWHVLGFGAAASVYFALLWQDTEKLASLETHAQTLVAQLPPNARVIDNVRAFPGSRFYYIGHLVQRACIGRCYAYSNYEPSSGQFRVRALPDSPVAASREDVVRMSESKYVVPPSVEPLFQVETCSGDPMRLCLRTLAAGETNQVR